MSFTSPPSLRRQNIAVIGSGIAGLSAAWLLNKRHNVTLYEKDARLGGHSNTISVNTSLGKTPVDTGFIVYNDVTYPNLTALFEYLGVASQISDMSFGVSLSGGQREYSSLGASAFLCGGKNLLSPRFWSMTLDLIRFYRHAPLEMLRSRGEMMSLGEFLRRRGYSDAFLDDHLLPQAAAIWSASLADVRNYPAWAIVRFFENHGLLKLNGAPIWRTVTGGAREYVRKLSAAFRGRVKLGARVVSVRRDGAGVLVRDATSRVERYDQIVIAAHADAALAMLEDANLQERTLLGACRYTKNHAILHTDRALMPRRETLWASWNYVGDKAQGGCLSYWMNKLQNIACREQLFLTLNPQTMPREHTILYQTDYDHPHFDAAAICAQQQLWSLQGVRKTWFCGAYFGAGFHEDGLQAGLAVAEQLSGARRPWNVKDESSRIELKAARAA